VTDDLRRPLLIFGVVMALVAVSGVIHAVRSGGMTRFQQLTDIPQVACYLTRRSPESDRRTSVFRPARRLRSRRLLKQGGSGRETTVFWLGSDVFQRGGQTCPATFVQFGHGSRSCA